MPVFDARDLLSFPGGDNSTDTVIGGIHFNLTTLQYWNYTLYSNGTVSNGSWCMLTFEPYTPKLIMPNGTFVNSTWCDTPINPIDTRGSIGVAFAVAFALCLIPVLANLTKHGKMHLPPEKRFYPIGRRWQWYWAIWVCASAIIGGFTGVDVDRYYILGIPIILNCFFWYLMQQGTLALVWEAVRHWGSWSERQYIDPQPFVLHQNDKRGMFEFWLPLWFYLWWWLNFFLIIPRNWGNIELQRSPEQTLENALPEATDARFKAAAFCLFVCWLTIMVSLRHSIKHYLPRNRGFINRLVGILGYTPLRFQLMTPLALAVVAYQALVAFKFDYSPLKQDGNLLAIALGGYAPSLLIVVILCLSGFMRPNEDRELMRQRQQRDVDTDQELGIVRKPAWWRRVNGDMPAFEMKDRLMRNMREVGGGRPTARRVNDIAGARVQEMEHPNNEMSDAQRSGNVARPSVWSGTRPAAATAYSGKSQSRRTETTMASAAGLLFPNATTNEALPPYSESNTGGRGRAMAVPATNPRLGISERSTSATSDLSTTHAQPQQIKSMLDI